MLKRITHNRTIPFKEEKDEDKIKRGIADALRGYHNTQVFDTRSTIDPDSEFITVYTQYDTILIRYNTSYSYLEILTPNESLHNWIWENFVQPDPDVENCEVIK